jgi:hypothetical protein
VTGLLLNLYVTLSIPSSFEDVFVLNAVLTVHIITAFLLVIGGVLLLRFGGRANVAQLRALSEGVLVSIIVALQEGFAFPFTLNNAFSFGMEMGFLGSMVLCGTILCVTNDPSEPLTQGVGHASASPSP